MRLISKKGAFLIRLLYLHIIRVISVGSFMRGDPKISGIVTKIYLKYSYKFETLVPFKVLPL
jgi:hypothetical protein